MSEDSEGARIKLRSRRTRTRPLRRLVGKNVTVVAKAWMMPADQDQEDHQHHRNTAEEGGDAAATPAAE